MPEERKTPQELAEEMQRRYRNVFGTAEGRIVLGDIMDIGHVFDSIEPNDTSRCAERNFAVVIGRTAGAFDSLYRELRMLDTQG